MTDRIFATAGDWVLGSDGIQWMLMRRKGAKWRGVWFVRSTKEILARGMRGKGVDVAQSDFLLSGLPRHLR